MGGLKGKMKIGFFGGTFDPPHLGHMILAVEAFYQLKLDSLHWILTPYPPHKDNLPITPVETRLELLGLVVNESPDFEISQIDLNRDPPHFAADTMEMLRVEYSSSHLVYLIGEDSLRDLPGWVDPGRFLLNIDQLAVAPRPQIDTDLQELEKSIPGLMEKTVFLSGTMLQVSSTFIRERIRKNGPFRHLLSPAVSDFINKKQLYQV